MKQANGGFTWSDIMKLAPFELELFYYMAVNDFKEENEKKQGQ